MKYKIQRDSSYPEPKVLILTSEITDEVNDLLLIYASAGKVISVTKD